MRFVHLFFVTAALSLLCLAFPHVAPGDKIKAGSYSPVMGKGPVPSFMKIEVMAAKTAEWPVKGSYRNQRVSLEIAGKISTNNGALTGKATPSHGYSGQGCTVTGQWAEDRLTVKLGAPYRIAYQCRYSGPQ